MLSVIDHWLYYPELAHTFSLVSAKKIERQRQYCTRLIISNSQPLYLGVRYHFLFKEYTEFLLLIWKWIHYFCNSKRVKSNLGIHDFSKQETLQGAPNSETFICDKTMKYWIMKKLEHVCYLLTQQILFWNETASVVVTRSYFIYKLFAKR